MSRPTGVMKLHNDYAAAVGGALYDSIPKAVWAAIAVSFASTGGDHMEHVAQTIAREWDALYHNGIVPQAPNKLAREAM